jgi:hypothetical protein
MFMADAGAPSLLPVIVGGLLTLAGGAVAVIGPIIIEARKALQERKRRRADKFEELVQAIYELDHWLDRERDMSLAGSGEMPGVSPFAKLQAISAVHFPKFNPFIEALQNGLQQYSFWNAKAQVKRVSGELKELPPDYIEAIKPYTEARDKLLDALKSFVHSEFQ